MVRAQICIFFPNNYAYFSRTGIFFSLMEIHQILKQYWGYDVFRPLQEDIINSALEGNDTLALLPTGGGKSLCFQVPALAKEGICLVVSPLIALMKDQVENLQKKGIKAITVNSSMHKREIDIALDNCVYGDFKFLYLSPERLETDIFKERVKKMNVNLIAVDEAHCISQWGYDFRPSYLKINELREILPNVPVIALTATATKKVVDDIQAKLKFKKPNVLQKSFERKNLAYVVIKEEDKIKRLLAIVNKVKGSGIVYVRNRKKTQETANELRKNKIPADFYHAGLDPKTRSIKQENWINNKSRVMVATNAFGMGIDKPDVRFVVHLDLPDSPEAYFQEAGRGGRDEKKAYAVLLYNDADKTNLEQNVLSSFPTINEIKKVYDALGNYFSLAVGSGEGVPFEFDISDFSTKYNLTAVTVYSALKFLEKENYIASTENFNRAASLNILVSNEELYKFRVANILHDEFLKVLLRSYGGLFEGYVNINENDIAKRTGKSREEVIKELHLLQNLNLISYFPQNNLPQITFTQPRFASKDVRLSKENYELIKRQAVARIHAVIKYVSDNHICRSKALLRYFGETDTGSCGICDVCLERNKLDISEADFEKLILLIKETVTSKNLTLDSLVENIPGFAAEKVIKVARWLIDSESIILDEENRLSAIN